MSNQIIVAADPYRDEPAPIALGAMLGRIAGASLRVVGIYSDQTAGDALSRGERDAVAANHARTALEARLAAMGAAGSRVHDARYAIEVVPSASAPRGLHELAASEDASLMVVGSTHRGVIGRLMPGSVTERVLHGSPCPVAVAPRGFADAERDPQRVGVAYARTPEGREALAAATLLAEHAGARLEVVTLVDPIIYPGVPPVEASAEEVEEMVRRTELDLRHEISDLGLSGESDVTVIGRGGIAELVERTRDFDLLVCGSRGYGPRAAVLLGGVSHTLMLQAHCPLIVIPRGARHSLRPLFEQAHAAA